MRNHAHERSREMASRATTYAQQGNTSEAMVLYAEAGDLERQALLDVPLEERRTWSILAVSAASLFYKARKYEQAEYIVHEYLANEDTLPFARRQLRMLLTLAWMDKDA